MNKNQKFQFGKGFTLPARHVMQTGGTRSPETSTGAPESKEAWRDVDAMAKFTEDMKKTFRDLANEAFPNDPSQQETYAKQIENSLINHLAAGKTMEELWTYLKGETCQVVAIVQGFLNYYKMVNGEREKINIDKFFNLGVVSELPLDREYADKRQELVEALKPQTQAALQNFLEELKGSLPDLPSYPS